MSILSRAKQFKQIIPALVLAGLLAMPAQAWDWNSKSVKGSGNVKTETRNASGFTRVSLSVPAKVEIVQGNIESISLEGDDNILPLIETVVEGGNLKIRLLERNMSVSTKFLKLTVNARTIEELSVAGSGDFHAASLQGTKFKASVAGSGDIKVARLDADALAVSISGSGNFAASGKVVSVETKIAGAGDIDIGKLEANTVKVSVAGSGNATVWAKDSLGVSVAGSGDVKYFGDPKISKSVAGSGNLRRLGTSP